MYADEFCLHTREKARKLLYDRITFVKSKKCKTKSPVEGRLNYTFFSKTNAHDYPKAYSYEMINLIIVRKKNIVKRFFTVLYNIMYISAEF